MYLEGRKNIVDEKFCVIVQSSVSLLVYRPWWNRGVVHGMTLRPLSFSSESREGSVRQLSRAFSVKQILVPRQSHSSELIDVRQKTPEVFGALMDSRQADAIVVQRREPCSLAFGITTADCVPLIVRSGTYFALIHAGWRGLANGIIYKVIDSMPTPDEVVIFPAAGSGMYEVGAEVVEAIGESAVCRQQRTGGAKYWLDTASTAARQVQSVCSTVPISQTSICTIEDTRFHSFRRDGLEAGRNLTFLKL